MLQSCPTLCDPMDCSPPGSSIHWILQARILGWIVVPSSRGSSWSRDRTGVSYVSCIGRWQVPPGKPLPTRVCLVKAVVFPVVMYGCESWTIKKAEDWRIDTFELWYCRRLLRVPCTTRRSNQSILKEINSEYPLEGLMLKLKLRYVGHLMMSWLMESRLMLGETKGHRTE